MLYLIYYFHVITVILDFWTYNFSVTEESRLKGDKCQCKESFSIDCLMNTSITNIHPLTHIPYKHYTQIPLTHIYRHHPLSHTHTHTHTLHPHTHTPPQPSISHTVCWSQNILCNRSQMVNQKKWLQANWKIFSN